MASPYTVADVRSYMHDLDRMMHKNPVPLVLNRVYHEYTTQRRMYASTTDELKDVFTYLRSTYTGDQLLHAVHVINQHVHDFYKCGNQWTYFACNFIALLGMDCFGICTPRDCTDVIVVQPPGCDAEPYRKLGMSYTEVYTPKEFTDTRILIIDPIGIPDHAQYRIARISPFGPNDFLSGVHQTITDHKEGLYIPPRVDSLSIEPSRDFYLQACDTLRERHERNKHKPRTNNPFARVNRRKLNNEND